MNGKKILLAALISVSATIFIHEFGRNHESFVKSGNGIWGTSDASKFEPFGPPDGFIIGKDKPSLYLVPTGIHNQQEFRTRPDGVARYFYDSYGVIDASPVTTDWSGAHSVAPTRERLYFISYRRNDKIYWTRKAHYVRVAETMDGGPYMAYAIRQRCGNLLSEWPEQPTEPAADQPTDAELGAESVEGAIGPSNGPEVVPISNPEVLQVQVIPEITVPIEEYQPFVQTGATSATQPCTCGDCQQMLMAGIMPFAGGYPIIPAAIAGVITPEPSQWKCLLLSFMLFGGILRFKYQRGEK